MIVAQRRNRQTGTLILINDVARDRELDEHEYRWETICDEHGFIVAHRTLALARYHAASPLDWCERCAEEETADQNTEALASLAVLGRAIRGHFRYQGERQIWVEPYVKREGKA